MLVSYCRYKLLVMVHISLANRPNSWDVVVVLVPISSPTVTSHFLCHVYCDMLSKHVFCNTVSYTFCLIQMMFSRQDVPVVGSSAPTPIILPDRSRFTAQRMNARTDPNLIWTIDFLFYNNDHKQMNRLYCKSVCHMFNYLASRAQQWALSINGLNLEYIELSNYINFCCHVIPTCSCLHANSNRIRNWTPNSKTYSQLNLLFTMRMYRYSHYFSLLTIIQRVLFEEPSSVPSTSRCITLIFFVVDRLHKYVLLHAVIRVQQWTLTDVCGMFSQLFVFLFVCLYILILGYICCFRSKRPG